MPGQSLSVWLLHSLLQGDLSSHVSPVSPGIIEGFKEEKASLQEALGRKEMSEQSLVAELESLNQQLQQVTRQQRELKEENSVLWRQKEVAATEAEEREAGKKGCLQGRRAEHRQQPSGFSGREA